MNYVEKTSLLPEQILHVDDRYDTVSFYLRAPVQFVAFTLSFWREYFGTDALLATSLDENRRITIRAAIDYEPTQSCMNIFNASDLFTLFIPYEPTQNTVAVYDSLYGKRQVPVASIENASRQLGFDLFPFVSEGRLSGDPDLPYYLSPFHRDQDNWYPQANLTKENVQPLIDAPISDVHIESDYVFVQIDTALHDISFDLTSLLALMKCTALWIEYMDGGLYIMPAQGTENVPIFTTGHMPKGVNSAYYVKEMPENMAMISIYTPTEVRHFTADELLSLEKETEIPLFDATQQGRFADFAREMDHCIYCIHWEAIHPRQHI